MSDFEFVKKTLLDQYGKFGIQCQENGTLLIGKAEYVGPMAYMHILFPGLSDTRIKEMQESLELKFPDELIQLYRNYNGLSVFNAAISIYGLRKDFNRSPDNRQPFDIFQETMFYRNQNIKPEIIVFGGYQWNGSKVYINLEDGSVCFCEKYDLKPIMKWSNIKEWIFSEIERLSVLLDADCKNLSLSPTVPIGGYEVREKLIELVVRSKNPPYWYTEEFKKKYNLN